MSRARDILDAAALLFYEKGFHGVSVDEIGEQAGVSGPALYYHFSGKDEILAILLSETLDELISASAAVHQDPVADLERLIRHQVEVAIAKRQLINLYQREVRSLVEPWKKQYKYRMAQYAARWEETLGRRYPAADPASLAIGVQSALGLIHSVTYWPSTISDDDQVVASICAFAAGGLNELFEPAVALPQTRARLGTASGI